MNDNGTVNENADGGVIFIGHDVFCPTCGDFDEGEPILRRNFTGQYNYEFEWIERHKCPICGTVYEYKNGDA